MSRQDWRTARSVFDLLNRSLGPFDLDCAADDKNHLCDRYYTEQDNALIQPWTVPAGKKWWVNIPFGDPLPWVEKAIEETHRGNRGVMLCLAGLSTEWFHLAWSAAELLIPTRRILYWHPDEAPVTVDASGKRTSRGFDRDSVIFEFDPDLIGFTASSLEIPPHAEEIRRLWAEANGQQNLFVKAG